MVNSATWGKQVRGEKWSIEETDYFYEVRPRPSSLPDSAQLT